MGIFDKEEDEDKIFDRVDLTLPSGEIRRLSKSQYEALPLSDRIRATLGRQVKFFLNDVEVPLKDVLKRG